MVSDIQCHQNVISVRGVLVDFLGLLKSLSYHIDMPEKLEIPKAVIFVLFYNTLSCCEYIALVMN